MNPPLHQDPDGCPCCVERTRFQLDTLTELARIGMVIARDVRRRVEAQPEDGPPVKGPDPALSFTRAARGVQQAIAQQVRIAAAAHAVPKRGRKRFEDPRKTRIRGILREAALDDLRLRDPEDLFRDIDERIEDAHTKDILARDEPIGTVVGVVAADLGFKINWRKQADDVIGMDRPPEPDPEGAPPGGWKGGFECRPARRMNGPDPP